MSEHKYKYTEVKRATSQGAYISVQGAPERLTTWDELEDAADQDASHHGHLVDDTTRELAGQYRILLGTAAGMFREQCLKLGRVLVASPHMLGQHFAHVWQLRHPGSDIVVHETGIEPFGGSIGLHECNRVARGRGYVLISRYKAEAIERKEAEAQALLAGHP